MGFDEGRGPVREVRSRRASTSRDKQAREGERASGKKRGDVAA